MSVRVPVAGKLANGLFGDVGPETLAAVEEALRNMFHTAASSDTTDPMLGLACSGIALTQTPRPSDCGHLLDLPPPLGVFLCGEDQTLRRQQARWC